jgi:hypothetical protein
LSFIERAFYPMFFKQFVHPMCEDQPKSCNFGYPKFRHYIVTESLVGAVFASLKHLLQETPGLELVMLERAFDRFRCILRLPDLDVRQVTG